jgi:aryl-alcohol dehydrogenase
MEVAMLQARAAITPEANAPFVVRDICVESPREGEVLVDIKAVGICHSDLVMVSGAFGTKFPAIFGHEGAGVVEAVGPGVQKVAPGDKVLLTFNSCGVCSRCRKHDPSYCEQFTPINMACARVDGSSRLSVGDAPVSDNFFGQSSFASKAIASERNIVKLPTDADLVMLAPLGCGVQTGAGAVLRSLAAEAGQSLMVIGGGSVGLSALLGGRIAACSPIIVVEPHPNRRTLAAELGADHTIDPNAGDLVVAVRSIVPAGVDLVVDTSGNLGALSAALGTLANKGKIGLVGLPGALDAALPVPIIQWLTQGGTLRGIVEGDSDPDEFLPLLIDHYAKGRLPVDRLITTYPFDRINDAVADTHAGKCVKAVLTL